MTTTDHDLFDRLDRGAFDGDEKRADLEQAHLLTQLTEHPGWAVLVEIIESQAVKHEHRILTGRCDDYGDYIGQALLVKGLREAISTPRVFADRVARTRPEETKET